MVLKTLSTYPPRLIFRIFKSLLQRSKKLKKSTKRAAKSDFFRRFNCCEPCPDNISDKTYDKWLFILYLIFFDFSRVLRDFFACNLDEVCFQKRRFSEVRSWIIRITCMIYPADQLKKRFSLVYSVSSNILEKHKNFSK